MKLPPRFAALAALFALVMACIAPARAETTITFTGWVNMFDFQKPGWARIIANFAKAHPDIKINYIGTPAEDTLRQITAAILAHQPPDIMQVSAPWVQQLDDQGALAPLGPLLGEDEIARLWKTGVDALTIDGNIQGVPWLPAPSAWVYNRDLFKRAGLDPDKPPTTWQQFIADVDKICALPSDTSGKVFGVVLRSARDVISVTSMPYYVWGFGGDIVDAKGRPDWNNPGAVKAFTWVRDTIRKGCSPEIGGANVLGISSTSKHKQAAAVFVRFLLDDPDSVNYFYQTSQQITTSNLDVIRDGPMSKDLFLKQYIQWWDKVDLLPIHSARIDAILDDVGLSLQKVIHGTDPTAEMKLLTQAIRDVDR